MNALIEKLGINIDYYAGLVAYALIFVRIFVTLMLTPFLGGKMVPGRIRMLVSLLLAGYVFYFIRGDWLSQIPENKALLLALLFKEIFIGFAMGLTAVMCFYAVEAGGRIVDNQRGSANAQIFLPSLGQVSIFGLFQFWVGISLFLFMGGHILFLKAIFSSFNLLPVFSFPHLEPGMSPFLKLIIRMSADVLILGMQLASPVLIAIFMADLVMGIANKMAPQIHVFELGFVLKGYVGVLMVYISILVITSQMQHFFTAMQKDLEMLIRLLAQG